MNDLLQDFYDEACELVEETNNGLLTLERQPTDKEAIDDVFRTIHTLKGASGVFEIAPFTNTVHAGEDLLDAVRDGALTLTSDSVDLLLEVNDQLVKWLQALHRSGQLPADAEPTSQRLSRLLRSRLSGVNIDESGGQGVEKAPIPHDWCARIPDDVRVLIEERAAVEDLVFVRYTPDQACYFSGTDPLATVSGLDDVLWRWVGIPDYDTHDTDETDRDPYQCRLVIECVCSGPVEAVETCFRYEPDSVIAAKIEESPADEELPVDESARARNWWLIEVRKQLSEELPTSIIKGVVRSVERVLARCLADHSNAIGIEEITAAAQLAIEQSSCAPLLALVDEALGAIDPLELAAFEMNASLDQPADDRSQMSEAKRQVSAVLRVEQSRVDKLVDLSGELVVAKNALPFLMKRIEEGAPTRDICREIKAVYDVVDRIADDFQTAVMHVRMVRLQGIFQKFHRLVRDTSRKIGKQVVLEISGEETEVDKNIVEKLSDPLVHLLRNSLDHGIEMPEVRQENGKPAEATIALKASALEDRVLIEISDDGKGIDPAIVREKAILKGVIDDERAAQLTDEQAINLILEPGFSTAESITELSGRGVGMDAVRTVLEECGGSLQIKSQVGVGTTIEVYVPLSMAVTQIMLIDIGDVQLGVSIDAIIETVKVSTEMIQKVRGDEVVVLRDRLIPLVRLGSRLGIQSKPRTGDTDELRVLVVQIDGEDVGLVVDRFHSSVDVLIRPLVGVLAACRHYSGSAIMGDGRVLLVVRLSEILS
ncbi:MAG: chemotaxis protein CheA [Pseudomonadota bacterium]